ncbi:MAG TPA: hypothetical protein DD414_06575, partial [Lachnospiraceae bacterium]|nr:hypothetical protein [Lachnospiraceae bacterium]
MTHQVKVLECQYQVHTHTDDCYEKDEDGNPTGDPVCGYADYVVHVHNDDCYDENGNLVCPLEEIEKHEHDDGCYEEKEVLVCEEGESEGADGHTHTDACYTEVKGDLICEASEEGGHTHDESCYSKTLTCDREEHSHDEGCYEKELVCDNEDEDHEHGDGCYKETLVCDKEEHTHGDGCYSEELTCGQEETGGHEHTDECYETKKELTCTEGESESTDGHTHDGDCYKTEKVLTCDKLELHTHTEALEEDGGCYDESAFDEDGEFIEGSRPVCGIPQLEEHVHTAECFKTVELTPEEVAALEGGAALHVHTEACYDEEGNLTCTLLPEEENKGHEHDMHCYDSEGLLVCGNEDAKDHEHDADCYGEDGELTCGYEGVKDHEHIEDCYDTDGNLICGYNMEHIHKSDCYDADGNLICKYRADGLALSTLYCDEQVHQHEADCYDEEGSLICGKADFAIHTHTDDCYNADGKRICPLPEIEAHTHDEACYPEGSEDGAEPVCGKEEIQLHTHGASCYDGDGKLTCGQTEILEHIHSGACEVSNRLITKTFENENFIITAVYKPDAGIPEDAELMVEQISEESDKAHYAERQTQYQEAMGDDNAVMQMLLKIGFYVDENGEKVEVEPESPVSITIQFLDESGLAEGRPVRVIHFGEDGAKLLGGGDEKDNSTTFRTDTFSEFGIGHGNGEQTFILSDTFHYDDEAVHISFHVEGKAGVLDKEEEDTMSDPNERTLASDIDQMITLRVKALNEGEDRYRTYADYLESSGGQNETLFLQVFSYRLFYKDNELDLTGCTVTAQAEPTEDLLESTQSMSAQEEASTNFFSMVSLSPDGTVTQKNVAETTLDGTTGKRLTVECFSAEPGGRIEDEITGENETNDEEIGNEEADNEKIENEAANGEETGDGAADDEKQENETINNEKTEDGEMDAEETDNDEAGNEEELEGMDRKRARADVATAVTYKVNPTFSVQFYANLNVPESSSGTSGTTIPFINTSKASGLGGLPENGNKDPSLISLGMNGDGTVHFNIEAIQIYKTEKKEFNPKLEDKLDIEYLNSLRDNKHYCVKELWVLKEISDESEEAKKQRASGTTRTDWTVYNLENGAANQLAFTNNPSLEGKTDEKGRTYIVVEEGTVMRLVYDPQEDSYTPKATFYDYDISKGPKTESTMTTYCEGINSHFTGDKGRFAFGNANMGTKFEGDTWNGNTLNKYNGAKTYMGLTLGLVKDMKKNDDGSMDVNFSDGVTGPSIGVFGNESGTGKIIYPNWNLKFNRMGDTFTLSSVSMSNNTSVASGLEKFGHPGKYDGTNGNKMIWTNNFWPLDVKWHDQEKILDPMFGGATRPKRSGGATVPPSDDGIDHNSYFGMTYSVDFDLVEEYVGPLEYYFYGDDDMWVFLDGKLVCDIGGVHSSVGEYVDLWDYIEKADSSSELGSRENHARSKHTLSVFYTERGASGSSCWMQFTLPRISQVYNTPYDPNAASLTITKLAEQFPDSAKDTEFPFALRLSGIYNKYTVRRRDINENILETNQISTEEYLFKLKSGEYLEVIGLPIGATYWIEEKYAEGENWDTTVGTNVSSAGNANSNQQEPEKTILAQGTIEGTVKDGKDMVDHVTVTYTNYYRYKLPETGGSGSIWYMIASAFFMIFGAGLMYNKK